MMFSNKNEMMVKNKTNKMFMWVVLNSNCHKFVSEVRSPEHTRTSPIFTNFLGYKKQINKE